MIAKALDLDILATTKYLADIICQNYENHSCGHLKGYLVQDSDCHVITRKMRKAFSAQTADSSNTTSCLGSVQCSETKPMTKTLAAMLIAYSVQNNLMRMFKDYPFVKFKIVPETYPQYKYEKRGLRRYKRTGDDVTFLKADIKW